MSLSTTPSLDSSVRPSFASGYASPLTGGMAHPDLWRGVVGAWSPALGATGGTLRDLSGNHNNGSIVGGTPAGVWANPASATLNGSTDYFDLATPITSAPLSMAVWFRTENVTDHQTLVSICTKSSDQSYFALYLRGDSGDLVQADSRQGPARNVQTSSAYQSGKWHLATAIWDASVSRVYLDGGGEGVSGQAPLAPSGLDVIGIGVLNRSSKFGYYDGELADVLIWDRVVSQREFEKLYRLGPGGIYERKIYVPYTQPTVEPAGSVGTFITSEVKPSYASGYASPITGGMAHESLWDGVVGAWCPSLGATGSTLRDLSGNHNHGTLTNMDPATDWLPEGLSLDGTDAYVDIGDVKPLDIAGHISVQAWVVIDAVPPPSGDTRSLIVSKGFASGNEPYHLGLTSDTGQLRWYTYDGSIHGNEWVHDLEIGTGRQYHIVGTFNGVDWVLYVDGVERDRVSDSTAVVDNNAPVYLGGSSINGSPDRYLDGTVDSVVIHNRALTANEVATLYRLGPAGIYQQKRPVITTVEPPTVEPPTVEPAGSVGTFITSEVKPSYASGYASPLTGGMAHPELWDGVVGAWCPSLGATGGTLRDLSGNHNHGTLTNMDPATDWISDGLSFDGVNDYVQVGNKLTSLPPHAGRFTIVAWVTTSMSARGVIGGWGYSGNDKPFAILQCDGPDFWGNGAGSATFTKRDNGGANLGDVGGGVINDGKPHMVAVTRDCNDSYTVYVDAQQVGQTTLATGAMTLDSLRFGNLNNGGVDVLPYDGIADGMAIWSRELVQNEIAELYRLGPAGIYQRKQPVITTAEEVVGGLSIPIAAYHYNHNVGSRL